jgi:hypothetical protein
MLDAAREGAAMQQAREWTEEERQAKRQDALRLDLGRHLRPRPGGDEWTPEETRLLGKLPDAEVTRRTGRTVEAVRIKREKMGLPNPESRAWTPQELSHLGTATDAKVADRLGRTASAVAQKRIALGVLSIRGRTARETARRARALNETE